MKVLHYSASLSRSAGGLYMSVSGLSKAQKDLGHSVAVAGGRDGFFEQDKSQWGDVDVFPTQDSAGYGLNTSAFGLIKNLSPDVFHIHGIWYAGSIYGRFAQSLGIPVVVSPRGMVDRWILARRPQVKAIHSLLFEHPLFKKAHLHALTPQECNAIAAFEPRAADRSFIVPNGISPPHSSVEVEQKSGALFLGRLHPKKQVLQLIEAWKKPLFKNIQLTIAGWGDAAYEDEVKQCVQDSPNVHFVGSLYGVAKDEALRRARFFLLPSLSEGLPMSVLEALAYGCIPVITCDCNLPELVANGSAREMKSDFSDFEEVCGSLFQLNEVTLTTLGRRAQKAAGAYTWESIAEKVIEKYDQIRVQRPVTIQV
jgi:glycosyltransferase involved in cell wall biosynthesis